MRFLKHGESGELISEHMLVTARTDGGALIFIDIDGKEWPMSDCSWMTPEGLELQAKLAAQEADAEQEPSNDGE